MLLPIFFVRSPHHATALVVGTFPLSVQTSTLHSLAPLAVPLILSPMPCCAPLRAALCPPPPLHPQHGDKVLYVFHGQQLLEGSVSIDHATGVSGILCACCSTVISCSAFEAHAGRGGLCLVVFSSFFAGGEGGLFLLCVKGGCGVGVLGLCGARRCW